MLRRWAQQPWHHGYETNELSKRGHRDHAALWRTLWDVMQDLSERRVDETQKQLHRHMHENRYVTAAAVGSAASQFGIWLGCGAQQIKVYRITIIGKGMHDVSATLCTSIF